MTISRAAVAACLGIAAVTLLAPEGASAQCCLTYEQLSGRRTYRHYPYSYSYGPRHDPYWSYNASYFPYSYQGDGSYYGLGYSGYGGRGWYGNYWYW